MVPARDGPGSTVLGTLRYEAVRRLLAGIGDRGARPADLEREQGIARNTLHKHRHELEALGALDRRELPGPPHFVLYVLPERGRELRALVQMVSAWLGERPAFARDPLGRVAWQAITALCDGWAVGAVQALIDGPLRSGELEAIVDGLTPAEFARLLRRMLDNGIVERVRGEDGVRRYVLTDWGRAGIGKLAALAHYERVHLREHSVAITVADGVDALRATLPLIELPDCPDALCEFVVRGDAGAPGPAAGLVWAEVRHGRVVRCGSGPAGRPADLSSQGSIDDWLIAVIGRRPTALHASGRRRRLGPRVVRELHSRLYEHA